MNQTLMKHNQTQCFFCVRVIDRETDRVNNYPEQTSMPMCDTCYSNAQKNQWKNLDGKTIQEIVRGRK